MTYFNYVDVDKVLEDVGRDDVGYAAEVVYLWSLRAGQCVDEIYSLLYFCRRVEVLGDQTRMLAQALGFVSEVRDALSVLARLLEQSHYGDDELGESS